MTDDRHKTLLLPHGTICAAITFVLLAVGGAALFTHGELPDWLVALITLTVRDYFAREND